MRQVLDGRRGYELIDLIRAEMTAELETIRNLIEDGQILPQCSLRMSRDGPPPSAHRRSLRIGVFPTAADPFHWMHLLGGLRAMALFRLDKVVYIITGSDSRKPDLLPAVRRHEMGRTVVRLYSPLFAYSPIALDSTLDGEANIFRILQLNPRQRIDAFYIAGTDHRHRNSPKTGRPDTIQKIEDGVAGKLYGYDERMNSVSVIFLGRGAQALTPIDTFLATGSIQEMPCEASSTSMRKALAGDGGLEMLAMLPHCVFSYVRKWGLYSFAPQESR